MILLDSELEPERRPSIPPGATQAKSRKTALDERLPGMRALNAFLRLAQHAVRLRGLVTVLLTSDAAVRRLNRRFRSMNAATDVLSFPAAEISRGEVAGDLAISVETARKQATACGHSLSTEIKVLILHGLLHLAGLDHENDTGEMARKERELRAKLGLPLGLIERAKHSGASRPGGHGRTGKLSRSKKP